MTTLDKAELYKRFGENIDALIERLMQIFELTHTQEIEHLSDPLLRWLDFRLRYVDPMPRPIALSNKFPKLDLPEEANTALNSFCKKIREGADINPYQGRGLTKRNDFSGQKREARTDLLWADWGIHHFHLSDKPLPKDRYFSYPADFLAFCIVGANVVAIIDVLPHPDKAGFGNPELIQTVASSWPAYIEQFKMHGIPAGGDGYSEAEIHELRSAGIAAPISLNGHLYIGPGLGISSASTSMRVTVTADRLREALRELVSAVCDSSGPFRPTRTASSDPLNFTIAATPRGLAVFEESSQYAFLLPRPNPDGARDNFAYLHDLLLPDWALHALITNQPRPS